MQPKPHPPAPREKARPPGAPPPASRIRVSIVEDDDWIRDNVAAILDASPDFSCVSRFDCAEKALAGLPHDKPDVVLMDIGLPGMNGIECARHLKGMLPSTQILMHTVYGDSENVFAALLAGASGYILKRTSPEALFESIRDIHRGESPMDGQIARQVVQYFNRKGVKAQTVEHLSSREHEVLSGLSRGEAYKQIAEGLGISIETVRDYIKRIYQKLHVHSRGEAVAKYNKF